jgi:signal transduction histidine kinase
MVTLSDESRDRRVLLLTPTGRDSMLISQTLLSAGIRPHTCLSIEEVIKAIEEGCGSLLVAEEALSSEWVEQLGRALAAQPAWSDLPIIVLTSGGEQTPSNEYKLKILQPLGNIFLVERPVRPATLISIIKSALRARERQYQIREQAKALQRSNEDLQRFAYAASHDLQEPLRMIASFSQLLARRNEGKLDEDSRLFLRIILNGVDRMVTLIRDLMEFARHTSVESPPPVVVDCNTVLGLALQHLQFKISETGASITFERMPVVLGHESRLLQVFQNLIGNALKYCERKPEIAITTRRDGNFWVVAVKDNGIGISPEHQERIFSLFQRLHAREQYPGSGIGLATCKRIIEQYGGRIWVESTPGQGSTFYFTLRAAETEAGTITDQDAQ